ncbi:GerMN domain-containing protein [Paenibacillus sp. 7124]|uniref:GerMN domain-containing protein n=1 Tax=Paenibacillus apii TaxID=1850370 RepID=A0A6M1PM74_9BACL|nr:GerMN domain-containing protein [Paenibacillus apii]NGM84276.1 GerMN domain-containing protein [Paenibacillus apii]NJJ38224.1 GerMN domain-containing protein [Paenibacillus apii]
MRIIKTIVLCFAIGLTLSIAGCGDKKNSTGGSHDPAVSSPATAAPEASPTEAAEKEEAIATYYGNADATGLVQKETVIRYSRETDKYLAALNALKTSPEDKVVSLCANTTFLSAELNSGKLTVDLHLPDEDRLGASGEELFLKALRNTLFQFKEVETFEVLVDGKQVESLMGHFDLPSPFTRSEY